MKWRVLAGGISLLPTVLHQIFLVHLTVLLHKPGYSPEQGLFFRKNRIRMIETTRMPTVLSRLQIFLYGAGILLAFWTILASSLCNSAYAVPQQKLLLESPSAQIRDGVVTIHLSLSVTDEEGLRALLKDGAVLELSMSVALERERSWWSNAEAAAAEFSSILRHDPLSRDFLVTIPTVEGDKEVRDRNLTRLLHASWRQLTLPVAPLEDVVREEEASAYLVVLNISLRHTEVPPWLQKDTVFWSSEVAPDEKRQFKFTLPDS